jgi:hypothetical protein
MPQRNEVVALFLQRAIPGSVFGCWFADASIYM